MRSSSIPASPRPTDWRTSDAKCTVDGYFIEAEVRARARHAGATYQQRLRARYSARVPRHIERLLLTYLPIITPTSKLGCALVHLRDQWPKLTRHIDHGEWPSDNNPCENAIDPFVIGRKGGSSQRIA